MFNDPIFLLTAILCIGVLVVLMVGIGVFTRGGEVNRKYGNKLMQLRIAAQLAAVLIILLAVWWRSLG